MRLIEPRFVEAHHHDDNDCVHSQHDPLSTTRLAVFHLHRQMMHEVLLLSVCPAVARRARRNVDPDSVIAIRARPIYTNHTSTPAQGDRKTTVSVSREIQCCQQRLEKTYVIRTRQDIRNLLILSGTLNLSGVQSARANPPRIHPVSSGVHTMAHIIQCRGACRKARLRKAPCLTLRTCWLEPA